MQTFDPRSQGVRLLDQLGSRGKYIFNMNDAKAAAQLEKIPVNQLNKILSNSVKQRKALRLRRGLYVNLEALPKGAQIHPFVISGFLIQSSAISHWSALHHHGLTEQIPQIITASTDKKVVTPSMRNIPFQPLTIKHMLEINGLRYEYITIKKEHFFGYERVPFYENLFVNITDKERTLLDVFIYPKMFGGMGGALDILQQALSEIDNGIDIKTLVKYAIKYNKPVIAKRLGWALEYLGVAEKLLKPLLGIPLHYYCRLDPHAPAKGHCDKRWMIQNNLIKE